MNISIMDNYQSLNIFFNEVLNDLKCQPDTKAYITSIFIKYKTSYYDLSQDSLTLIFAHAKNKQDFLTFQTLGDWIFFSKSFAPESLNNASDSYYRQLGQLSYDSCYKLINKQWKLFDEMASNFENLELQTRYLLKRFNF